MMDGILKVLSNVKDLDKVRDLSNILGRNANTILTGVAVIGVIGTAMLASKQTLRVSSELKSDKDFKTKTKQVWKGYIPTVIVGSVTIGSIIWSNNIHMKRMAAMASAYSLLDSKYGEYKETGKAQTKEVRSKETSSTNTVQVGNNEVLCQDLLSGRYFNSTILGIERACLEANRLLLDMESVRLNTLYEELGLEPTSLGEDVGWTDNLPFEVVFDSAITETDGLCVTVDFEPRPSTMW